MVGRYDETGIEEHGVVLDAADGLLAPFYEAVFRSYLRRIRGEGDAPAVDPPAAIQPFLHYKPGEAVRQTQVRGVLRYAFARDGALREMCASEVKEVAPTPAEAWRAVESGEWRGLAGIVSRAALLQVDGWDRIAWIGAAAQAGRDQARGAAAEDVEARLAEAARRDEKRLSKIEGARDKVVAQRDKALDDAASMREQRDELRRQAVVARRELDAAREQAEERLHSLEETRDDNRTLRETLEDVRRRRREMAEAFGREREALQSRIRQLDAAKVPDLEAQAEEIESIAARLRKMQADLSTPLHEAEAGETRGCVRETSAPRRPEHPPGMRPGSRDALRWALNRPECVVLVDAYNVIMQSGRGWADLRGPDQRRLLLSRCESMLPPTGAEMWVVFDTSEPEGRAAGRQHPRIRHEFACGTTADDRLVEIAASLPEGRLVYAATSDRELRERLEAVGAAVVTSETFLEVAEAPRR